MTELVLPWPPSVNHYWRHARIGRGTRVLISAKGRAYREAVKQYALCGGHMGAHMDGRLSVSLDAYPPDRRVRDIDNCLKAPLDAATWAGVWMDDSQIDALSIRRMDPEKGGRIVMRVEVIG